MRWANFLDRYIDSPKIGDRFMRSEFRPPSTRSSADGSSLCRCSRFRQVGGRDAACRFGLFMPDPRRRYWALVHENWLRSAHFGEPELGFVWQIRLLGGILRAGGRGRWPTVGAGLSKLSVLWAVRSGRLLRWSRESSSPPFCRTFNSRSNNPEPRPLARQLVAPAALTLRGIVPRQTVGGRNGIELGQLAKPLRLLSQPRSCPIDDFEQHLLCGGDILVLHAVLTFLNSSHNSAFVCRRARSRSPETD